MSLCGEPDRPEVQKNIDDLDNNLLTITGEFDKRSRTLEEALERSMYFQEELMVSLGNIPDSIHLGLVLQIQTKIHGSFLRSKPNESWLTRKVKC